MGPIFLAFVALETGSKIDDFWKSFWWGRRQWGGLPNYADSAEHGQKFHSRPAPPAGVRRILWATPSAAGPRSLLIVSGLQILGSVASGSWYFWDANVSFGMNGGFTLASWGDPGPILGHWGA